MDALSTAVEKIEALPAHSRDWGMPLGEAAAIMVDQTWRIWRAIDGLSWRYTDETYPALLVRCRDKIAKMEGLGAAGHWAFSHDALVALKQAERALEVLTGAAVLTAEAA